MNQAITKCEFHDKFRDMGRGEQFSYEGKNALYDWLEDLSEDTGEEYSLDVIALCCEFAEYADLEEFQADYGEEYETVEDIENNTTVMPAQGDSFIIQQF